MQFKLLLISIVASFILAACGQGSSTSSDTRGKQSNFVGTQTIVLNNGGSIASEVDDLIVQLEGDVITIVDEDFSATGQLSVENQFFLSSPMFSTTSGGITCTGSVNYFGVLNGDRVSGNISGRFNCSNITFEVSGTFSGSR